MEAVGGPSTWRLGGAFNCGKAQPGQVAAVSHGCPSALFRGVNVLNTRRKGPTRDRRTAGRRPGAGRGRAPDGADETIVLVTDRAEASLRWAGNSMTTNGVSVNRSTTVVSIVRQGDSAHVGSRAVQRGRSGRDSRTGGRHRSRGPVGARGRDGSSAADRVATPADWDAPVPGTGAEVFADVAGVAGARVSRPRHVVRVRPPRRGDDVPGHLDRDPAALHAAHGIGGDQRQAGRRQRVGGHQHPVVRRRPDRPAAGRPVDAAGLGVADRRPARRSLRDDHAAVDRRRHDDLPGLDDGRPRRAGGPHRAVGARRRNAGGGEAHRSAADAVLRSGARRPGVRAVRQAVGSSSETVVGVRQRPGHRAGGLDPRRCHQRAGVSAGDRPSSSTRRSRCRRPTC